MGFMIFGTNQNCLKFIPLKYATAVIAVYAIVYMSIFTSVKAGNSKECERAKDNDTSVLAKARKFTDPIYYATSVALALSAVGTLYSIYKDCGQVVITTIFVVLILLSFLIQEIILILDTITNFQHANVCSLGISSGITSTVTLPLYLYYASVVNSYTKKVSAAQKKLKAASSAKKPVKKEPVKKEPVKTEPVKKEPEKKEPVKKEPPKIDKKEPVTSSDEAGGFCGIG